MTLVTRLPVPASTAFSLLTDPVHIRSWWAGPGGRVANVQIDARDAGLFWIAAVPEGGPGRSDYGCFTCVIPGELIEADWTHDATRTSRLVIQLVPLGVQTEVSLHHRDLPDPATREMQEAHWRQAFAALGAYAETCAADDIDPDQ
ncbi:SRPBCC domain-containing protein [Sphingomonas sp. R647]|nr:SRPBCC domain-containing protein [Sphingomonas sp. R647]